MSITALLALMASSGPAFAADKPEITPTIQLQVWTTVWDQDEDETADPAGYGDPEHDPGFTIRRGRAGLAAVYGPIDAFVEIGVGAPSDALIATDTDVRIQNAHIRGSQKLGPGTGRISAGLIKVPFSREAIMSSRDLTFQDRAVHTGWMAPIQDLGVLADWEADFGLRVQAGVFNGGGNIFSDDGSGLLYGGRLEYSKGDTYVTSGPADPVAFGAGISAYFDDDIATQTFAFEGDFLLRAWRFHATGEYAQAMISPGDSTVDLPDVLTKTTRRGISGQIGYTQPLGQGGLEIATRIGTFDDATSLQNNGDVAIIHAGATWRDLVPTLDLGVGFIHREELQGRKIANDTIRIWTQFAWPARHPKK
jgi:hypothetical protein